MHMIACYGPKAKKLNYSILHFYTPVHTLL